MPFSAFARFGNGFRFSSKPPAGQIIYETLREGMGETYDTDFNSRPQARLYAQAMCLSAAQYETERAGNNQRPRTANELLPALERDHQIVPRFGATKHERRQVLAARDIVTRGPRQGAVEEALINLLGDDFIAYEPTPASDAAAWPSSPGSIGVFSRPGAQQKLFRIDTNVSTTGTPVTVSFVSLGGTDAPMPGEEYTVDPNPRSPRIEKITIDSVSGSTLQATFAKAHPLGTLAARPYPLWTSTKRYNRIIVTLAAATDPETRRKINEQMKRQLRGVSQWCIVSNEGAFVLDSPTRGILDATGLA